MKMSMQGCFSVAVIISVAVTGVAPCEPTERDAVFRCRDELAPLIRQHLDDRYGIDDLQISDLENDTVREYIARASKDIVCNSANTETAACLVDNLARCPSLLQDSNFTSLPIGQIFSNQWDVISNADNLCGAIPTVLCTILVPKFRDCYEGVYRDQIVTDGSSDVLPDVCVAARLPDLDCLIGVAKDHCTFFYDDDKVPISLRNAMAGDRWSSFDDGNHLCDCYKVRDCWSQLKTLLESTIATGSATVRTTYSRALKLGETICQNQHQLLCAQPQLARCQVFKTLLRDKDNVNNLYLTAISACPYFLSDDYPLNKDCILDRLVDDFHPCIVKQQLPSEITKCSDLRSLHKCLLLALRGQCGGNVLDPMFELLRGDMHKVEDCQISGAPSFHKEALPSLTALYVLGMFMYALVGTFFRPV